MANEDKIFCIPFLISLRAAWQEKSYIFIENKGHIIDECGKWGYVYLWRIDHQGQIGLFDNNRAVRDTHTAHNQPTKN